MQRDVWSRRTSTTSPGRQLARLRDLAGARASGLAVAARQGRLSPGPDQLVARHGPVSFVARIDDRASIHSTHVGTLRWLADLLDDRAIDYWALRRDESFVDLGIPRERASEFLAALGRSSQEGWPVLLVVNRWGERIVMPPRALSTMPNSIGVVLPHVTADGAHSIDVPAAVEVGFWPLTDEGARKAPRWNTWASELGPPVLARPIEVVWHGVRLRTLADLAASHVEHSDLPIDFVYTWVDGNDHGWQQRLAEHLPDSPLGQHQAAAGRARYRTLDELRYSLRSVHQFAPWVRRIWLVTDGQKPSWLVPDDNLRIVDHRDLWKEPADLPVFNSHAIESQLHRIRDLSEHYVYMNDDVFLAAPMRPTAFFTPGGLLRFHPSPVHLPLGEPAAGDKPAVRAGKNDREILLEATGRVQTRRLKHTGHPQRRSIGEELAAAHAEAFARTAGARFRLPTDISPVSLHSWFAYATGRAVPAGQSLKYVDLGMPDARRRLAALRDQPSDFVCLNQTEGEVRPEVERTVTEYLSGTLPFRSPWESD